MVVGSPGVGGTSNSSTSSGASWRSGTPSPPLSDEGAPSTSSSMWPALSQQAHMHQAAYNAGGSSSSSTPGSSTTLDEGIVPDYLEEQHPRKKKVRSFTRTKVSFCYCYYYFMIFYTRVAAVNLFIYKEERKIHNNIISKMLLTYIKKR